jgi:exopolysaccharide production protein ExoZ
VPSSGRVGGSEGPARDHLANDASDPGTASGTGRTTGPLNADVLSIQYLRGVAAVGVLIFHAADRTGSSFGLGGAGVDVFFVISGFIMWTIGARRPLTPGAFLIRRVIRIVPLYWSVTLALAGTWLLLPSLLPNLSPTPSHVLLSLFFIPHVDPAGTVAPLLVPGWTLNYEAFFYLLFATTLLAPLHRRLWLLTGALVALAMVGLVLNPTEPVLAMVTDPLLLEFAAGAWIAKAALEGRTAGPVAAASLLFIGLALLIAGEVSGIELAGWRVIWWGVPAAFLIAGAIGLEAAGRIPKLRLPKLIGDASYSIYLVHGLAISFAVRMAAQFALPSTSGLVFFAAVLAGLVAGVTCFLLVERPILRRLRPPGSFRADGRPSERRVPV